MKCKTKKCPFYLKERDLCTSAEFPRKASIVEKDCTYGQNQCAKYLQKLLDKENNRKV